MERTTSLEIDTSEPVGDFDAFFDDNFERTARAAAFVTRDAGTGQDIAQEAAGAWGEMSAMRPDGSEVHRIVQIDDTLLYPTSWAR